MQQMGRTAKVEQNWRIKKTDRERGGGRENGRVYAHREIFTKIVKQEPR